MALCLTGIGHGNEAVFRLSSVLRTQDSNMENILPNLVTVPTMDCQLGDVGYTAVNLPIIKFAALWTGLLHRSNSVSAGSTALRRVSLRIWLLIYSEANERSVSPKDRPAATDSRASVAVTVPSS